MTDLPLADASVAGLVAFWPLVHMLLDPDGSLPGAVLFARRQS